MTMPYLMNCQHQEDGWCLPCVKHLWEDLEELNSKYHLKLDRIAAQHDLIVNQSATISRLRVGLKEIAESGRLPLRMTTDTVQSDRLREKARELLEATEQPSSGQ